MNTVEQDELNSDDDTVRKPKTTDEALSFFETIDRALLKVRALNKCASTELFVYTDYKYNSFYYARHKSHLKNYICMYCTFNVGL